MKNLWHNPKEHGTMHGETDDGNKVYTRRGQHADGRWYHYFVVEAGSKESPDLLDDPDRLYAVARMFGEGVEILARSTDAKSEPEWLVEFPNGLAATIRSRDGHLLIEANSTWVRSSVGADSMETDIGPRAAKPKMETAELHSPPTIRRVR